MPEPRRLAILTTGRQDYGVLRSTILALTASPDFEVRVWAGGMHLEPRFGMPLELLTRDGVSVAREIRFLVEPPEPVGDTARALIAVGAALEAEHPDALVLPGDRTETLAAGLAATLARIPIVHVHGGEETEGAIDNACRHALTKLSHLHLVSHPVHARRVLQLGEDPDTVVVVGAPGLDNAYREDLPDRASLERDLGIPLRDPVVLVTVHPTTLGGEPLAEVTAVAGAMAEFPATYVITSPNSDVGGQAILDYWHRWTSGRQGITVVGALGEQRYWAILKIASLVLGNSSSGIIEAPALGVPAINVGDRQRGRLRLGGIVDVPAAADAILSAVRAGCAKPGKRIAPPADTYPAGPAAPRIVEALRRWSPPRPPRKRFRDLP